MEKKTEEIAALITTRPGFATDEDFIYSTWLNGLYFGNSLLHEMREHQFKINYQKVIQLILSHSDIQVACLQADPDVILGYSVTQAKGDHQILHWIFVKTAWRKMGIAKSLLPSSINVVTHLTKMGAGMKPNSWEYNPFLI